MKARTLTYEELKESQAILKANPKFNSSIDGFLQNVHNAFKEKEITYEQKNELLTT